MLELLPWVLGSLLGWLSLYLLLCGAFRARGAEWNCRLVTLSHGVIIVLLTAYVVFIDGPWPSHTQNTVLQERALSVCLGYFFFDLSWCVLHRSEGPVMMTHHGASIAAIAVTLWLGSSGCETCGVVFGSELTNPLLQARWFLRHAGRYDSLLGDAVDVAFISLFAGVRVGVGSVMFYRQLTSPRPALVMKLGGVVMYALAWVFMVDIARFCFKKSKGKYRRWKERLKLFPFFDVTSCRCPIRK
uniref:TLC domain containing 5b n=1 Tax=Neogobius melanostomus TaxID=47308 RepID=A0A8C6TM11_9GOBI